LTGEARACPELVEGCPPNSKSLQSLFGRRGINRAEKRCRKLPAGGLGVSPKFQKSPKTGGYKGLKSVAERSLFYLNLGKKIVI